MTERQEREESVIGVLIIRPDQSGSTYSILKPKHFTAPHTRLYYEALLKLSKDGTQPDVALIMRYIEQADPEHAKLCRQMLPQIMEKNAFISDSLKEITKQVCDDYFKDEMQRAVTAAGSPEEISKRLMNLEEERQNTLAGTEIKPHNMRKYGTEYKQNDLAKYQQSVAISTGFEELDKQINGGLCAGLYTVGAISSLGKTTLMHQIADNIARSGTPVLFFSLEQSTLELYTKSVARINAQQQLRAGKRSDQLKSYCTPAAILRRYGIQAPESQAAESEYLQQVAENIEVIEGNFSTDIDTIKAYIYRFARQNRPPVVVVDYLQVLQAGADQSGNTKDNVDHNVVELKRISRDLNIPVIVISSFNRSNYMQPAAFESFKESGGIEYTADTVFGMQLSVLDDDMFNKPDAKTTIKAKRDKISEAKKAIPRKIKLCCLKNRNGTTSFDCYFDYYPQYDLFIPEGKQEERKPDRPFEQMMPANPKAKYKKKESETT